MRINVNLSEDLIKKIDEKAKSLYLSRSAYISMCLGEKLQFDEVIESMPKLISLLETLPETESEKK